VLVKLIKLLAGIGLVTAGWFAFQSRETVLASYDWEAEPTVELAVTTTVVTSPPTTRRLPDPPEPALALPQRRDTRGVALPRVARAPVADKTVIEFSGGTARLLGTVEGPEGPVAGSVVRLDRAIDDQSDFIDIATGEDGTFEVTGLPGGRYQVRAWRQPDLAMLESFTAFLRDGEEATFTLTLLTQTTDLELKGFTDAGQFKLGARPRFGVTVRSSTVGSDGRVYLQGAPGQLVTVQTGGALANQQLTMVTDAQGVAVFSVACVRSGPASIMFWSGEQVAQHPTPACAAPPPPTTTTTAAPPTTAPDTTSDPPSPSDGGGE